MYCSNATAINITINFNHNLMIPLPPGEYLAGFEPFSLLDKEELQELVESMDISLYKAGKYLFKRGKKINKIFFVREGKVGLFDGDKLIEVIGNGEMLGFSALKDEKTEFEAKALEETVCFEFKADKIRDVMGKNDDFRNFVDSIISRRFSELARVTGKEFSSFTLPVLKLIKRQPVICHLETSLGEIIQMMRAEKVGSVVVVNNMMSPLGIVTYADVIRALAAGMDMSTSVREFMSSPIYAVDSEASVFDAYMKFVLNSVRYLAVVENGKLVGVLSLKDIVSSLEPRLALVRYTKRIVKASDIKELRTIAKEIEKSFRNFVQSKFSYSATCSIFSSVLDSLTAKMVEMIHGNTVTVAQGGEIGRREVSYPLRFQLIVISPPEKFESCIDPVCDEGMCEKTLLFCSERVRDQISELNSADLLWLADSRYLHGSGGVYVKFRNILSEFLKMEVAREELYRLLEQKVREDNVDELISSVARCLSVYHGDLVARPTTERLELLAERGLLEESMIRDVVESYLAVRQIKLEQSVLSSRDRLADVLMKKIVHVVEEFFDYVGDAVR